MMRPLAVLMFVLLCFVPTARAGDKDKELHVGHAAFLYDHPYNMTASSALAFADNDFGIYFQVDLQLQRAILFAPALEAVTQSQRFIILRMGALPLRIGPVALGLGGQIEGLSVLGRNQPVENKENLGGFGGELTAVFQPHERVGLIAHFGKQVFTGDQYRSFFEAHLNVQVFKTDNRTFFSNFGFTLAVTKGWFDWRGEPWATSEYLAGIGVEN